VTQTTATAADWLEGARPRTLPAALAPVLVGTGAAAGLGRWHPVLAALALMVAVAMQVGVNYANDYSDGIRGTDRDRVGPLRLVGSGLVAPSRVKAAAIGCLAIGAAAGVALVALSAAWWLLVVGVGLLAAAWFYTGGSKPYGYSGFGELAVFVCFGVVPVLATAYTQAGRVDGAVVAASVGVGFLACALLVANNLRDVHTDAEVGKHTLAVRLGEQRTRLLYAVLVTGALALVPPIAARYPWAWLALACAPLMLRPLRTVLDGTSGRALIPVLAATSRVELVYAGLLAVGFTL
jgi:1,4-dihydroxy-2-naphthoate octaprenyltransferase